MSLDEEQQIDEILREYTEIFNGCFNGLHYSGAGRGMDFHAEFSIHNRNYINSDYYYDLTQNRKFIHFTTLPNLFSILSERAIRLYSLTNSNDAEEYAHTAQIIQLRDGWQKYAKENSFTFSLCELSELYNKELWNIYAKNSTGCCIEFEITNDPLTWKNFHFSGIKYAMTDGFVKFKKGMDALKEKYSGEDFNSELGRLMIFHKTAKWKNEKEIRLATYTGDWEGSNDRRDKDIPTEMRISDKNEVRFIDFVKHPIAIKKTTDQLKNTFCNSPEIKIKSVYLGENIPFNYDARREFRVKVLGLIQEKIGQFNPPDYIQVKLFDEWYK